MTTTPTLDRAIETIRQQSPDTQEVVGEFVEAAMAGENISLAEAEQRRRDQLTLIALQEVERGEYISVEEARAELRDRITARRG